MKTRAERRAYLVGYSHGRADKPVGREARETQAADELFDAARKVEEAKEQFNYARSHYEAVLFAAKEGDR